MDGRFPRTVMMIQVAHFKNFCNLIEVSAFTIRIFRL